MVVGWVYDRDQGEDWSNTGDSGRDPGLAGKKQILFYHFGKSFFCAKLQIVKLYIEKLFPQENLEIYAHLNIYLHLARGSKMRTFFIRGSQLVQREWFWAGKIGNLGKANGLQTPPREYSLNHRFLFKIELLKMMFGERCIFFNLPSESSQPLLFQPALVFPPVSWRHPFTVKLSKTCLLHCLYFSSFLKTKLRNY